MMTKTRAGTWMLALAGLIWVAPALAKTDVDETVKASATGRISISNVSGSIVVEAWDKKEVRVTGTLDDKVKDLIVEESGGDVDIEVELPRRISGRGGAADLKITIPKGASLEVNTVSANISVDDVEGELELESVSGSVDVNANAVSAEISTVSGSITVNGSVKLVEAESVSGSVTLRETSGEAEVATTSGRIEVDGGDFETVNCVSVSGTIRFSGSPRADSEFAFENFSGSIRLELPKDLNAELEVETFSGSISSDFGGRSRREEFGPGEFLNTTIGNGSAEIIVSTFSGSVEIRER
ncbi:MAG: hypothetical protein DHS20C21_12600 [Gemmatimonadota bacterium]|nr:MAG: hypothetical protein DHS20C21_12600 [Gemmatimonadota bacterium]